MIRRIYIIVIMTLVAMAYTHQQFLIVKTHYDINDASCRVTQLLDRNKKLLYNVATLESPGYLEGQLARRGVAYVMPSQWKVAESHGSVRAQISAQDGRSRFAALDAVLEFFTTRAEAQDARTAIQR